MPVGQGRLFCFCAPRGMGLSGASPLMLVPRTQFLGRVRDGESLMPRGMMCGVSGLQVLTRFQGAPLGRGFEGAARPSHKRVVQEGGFGAFLGA